MRKRTKTIIKILVGSMAGLAIASFLLFLWYARPPTTQLTDTTGKALTTGGGSEAGQTLFGGPLFQEAQSLIKNKEFAAAEEMLLQILDQSDRDAEACILLSDVSRELENVEAAVDYGLKAVELLPDNAEAHLSYARALGAQIFADIQSFGGMLSAMARLGHFKTAIDRVIELDADDTEARTMLVFYYLSPRPIGDPDRAIEVCREIESRDPVNGKQLLAMALHRKGETEQAINLLRTGLDEYPDECSLHLALANLYAQEKSFEAADSEFQAARRGDRDDVYYRSLYSQARMRIVNEFEPARAIELLDEFIAGEPEGDRVPSVAHACWRKGNALEQLGRIENAREAYQESLRREPGLKLALRAIEDLQQ